MAERLLCDICGRTIPPHGHYVVRIEVFADPSIPAVSQEQIEEVDFEKALAELLAEMKDLSEEELQDQVHRQFEYRLCHDCQMKFLVNPLGKPRDRGEGRN
ncbi:MAG: hypothetical protein ACM359_05370 [Bacillota bacterium]